MLGDGCAHTCFCPAGCRSYGIGQSDGFGTHSLQLRPSGANCVPPGASVRAVHTVTGAEIIRPTHRFLLAEVQTPPLEDLKMCPPLSKYIYL